MGVKSCLKNQRYIVQHIPKKYLNVTDSKHVLYGGMAENVYKAYTVPKLKSGTYANVLTDEEKSFLEQEMGLELNALSIYKKPCYWDEYWVKLTKANTYLDLSIPEDYIKYKVLLANKNNICPSARTLEDTPKASYDFVLIPEGEENNSKKAEMTTTMKCYKEYGKIEDDKDVMRCVIEAIEGKPIAGNQSLETYQIKINDLIKSNAKLFLSVVTDELLPTKVFIKKCIDKHIISNRGGYYYVTESDYPLCNNNAKPTINVAASFLNEPKNNQLKLTLEAKLEA